MNDIEQDEKYEDWPSDLNSLLMPMFPGEPPNPRASARYGLGASRRGAAGSSVARRRARFLANAPRDHQASAPAPAGRLPTVRRNVLTAVYLFDPASPAALDIGALARQADLQMWPLRIGLVPVVPQRAAHARGAPGKRSLRGPRP